MNEILTTLSLLIAAYAMLPDIKKIDFRIRRLKGESIAFFVTVFMFLVFLVYNGVFIELIKTQTALVDFEGVGYIKGFDQELSTFSILLLLICLYLGKLFFGENLYLKENFIRLRAEVNLLMIDGRYSDINYLLEKYYTQMKYNLGAIIPVDDEVFLSRLNKRRNQSKWGKQGFGELLSLTLTNRAFVSWMIVNNPELLSKFLLYEFRGWIPFSDLFLDLMINNKNSFLYREIQDEQFDQDIGKHSKPVLWFLTINLPLLEKHLFWQFGNYILKEIESDKNQRDYYNDECRSFSDPEDLSKYDSKIYVAIRLYKLVIEKAIHQKGPGTEFYGVEYFKRLVEVILDSMIYGNNEQFQGEYGNKYEFLLTEIFSVYNVLIRYSIDYQQREFESVLTKNMIDAGLLLVAKTYTTYGGLLPLKDPLPFLSLKTNIMEYIFKAIKKNPALCMEYIKDSCLSNTTKRNYFMDRFIVIQERIDKGKTDMITVSKFKELMTEVGWPMEC